MAVHSPRKLTYQDFEKIPDDGLRHEVLDGVHIVSPSPSTSHQRVSLRLTLRLAGFVESHRLGEVFSAPYDVVLSNHDIVVPDLVFVSASRAAIITEKNAQGAPDLVVEILSPGSRRRDLGKKLFRYENLGVAEYWVVDPKAATVRVYRTNGEAFAPPVDLSAEAGDRLTTPLLPGFELALVEVFGSSASQ